MTIQTPYRTVLGRLAASTAGLMWALSAPCAVSAPVPGFHFANVQQMAAALAHKPYHKEPQNIPPALLKLSYSQYRAIRFRPSKALWRKQKLPFEVQFFHPGFYYNRSVQINVIQDGVARPVPFSTALFHYGKNTTLGPVPNNMGFAGFRIHYRINTPKYFDEVAAFLGASYFRAVPRGGLYGLSARGLAVDTALRRGEEFPYFSEFWLRQPTLHAKSLVVYALLNSKSLTGAYRFRIIPGRDTLMRVRASIYLRTNVGLLGVAPLTSMFFHGTDTRRCFNDFRPQVHDSDGLLIHAATGEWVWRPLMNPRKLVVSAFSFNAVDGFGLLQRDRNFDHYQDLEARYDLRPSLWVHPDGSWGAGKVDLVEIPTVDEKHDNIVAFWVPHQSATKGSALSFAYTLTWFLHSAHRPPGGFVEATRLVKAAAPHVMKFIVDFNGKELRALPASTPMKAMVSVAKPGDLVNQQIEKNPVTGGWRVVFRVRTVPHKAVELRCFLETTPSNVLTETWSYLLAS